jgi:hypothetical protein
MRENKEHAASMLNPPFSVDAAASGLKSLGRAVDLIGPYQATGAFVLRVGRPEMRKRWSAISPAWSKLRAG